MLPLLCGAYKKEELMDENPGTQLTDLEEMPTAAKKSRRWSWVILGVMLVLVLAAAAFLGGRYLKKGPQQATGQGNGIAISNGPGGGRRFFSNNDIIPAPELPKTAADARGIFVRRQDNSFYVGTGKVQLSIEVKPGGTPQSGSSYDGPLVEVVATANTKIYRDDTDLPDVSSTETKIQQKVSPGDLDEIGQNSTINAWGKKVGDRLVADVILYSNPVFKTAPGVGGKP
jgi:hypothetical protein